MGTATDETQVDGSWFWSPHLWLPPNTTWQDMDRTNQTIFIPNATDLLIPFPIAVVVCLVRFFWESVIAHNIGRYYKLKENSPRRPQDNELLESIFKINRQQPAHKAILELCKKLDWTPRQLERWWRRRRVAGQPSEIRKFKETSWRFLYYLVAFWYGVYILWDKPWAWDAKQCWTDYPKQHLPTEMWYYYMVSLGFYWALVLSIFRDQKRKDFVEQLIHHFATILLIGLSWSINAVRVGALIICVHDAVDYWMESAKMAKYLKYPKLCDALFVIFTVVWFITRTGIYPFFILKSTLFESYVFIGPATYYVSQTLLLTLQLLHIIWSVKIIAMVYSYIICGEVEKDERSETEPNSTSEDETEIGPENNNSITNGNGLRATKNMHRNGHLKLNGHKVT